MELWDLYDRNRVKTGKSHVRGTPLPPGMYHLAITVVTFHPDGKVLLTRRSPEKKAYPGWWENTGGSALQGETSLQAACRELQEETGISAKPEEMTLLIRETRREDTHFDIYAVTKDISLDEVCLQPGETDSVRWMELEDWLTAIKEKKCLSPVADPALQETLFSRLRAYAKGCREFTV